MQQALNDKLYALYRDMLYERIGLFYPEQKRTNLEQQLAQALQATKIASLADLYAAAKKDTAVWDILVKHLTIGETYFFRNTPQFNALRNHILPDIMQRNAGPHTIRIWSAGCSSGEEPYSLAMTLLDQIAEDEREKWSITILATDLNPDYLVRAREALYGEWSFRETTPQQRARFFVQEGNRWRVRPEIRKMVTFTRLNLIEGSYPSIPKGICAFDLLVCRNVTIYFNVETTRQIVGRFYDSLRPGGWLMVGHAEPNAETYQAFQVYNFPDTIIYRKSLEAPLFTMPDASRPGTAENSLLGANIPLPKLPSQAITPPLRQPQQTKAPTPVSLPPKRSEVSSVIAPPIKEPVAAISPRENVPPESTKPVEPLQDALQEAWQQADRGEWQAARRSCEQSLVANSLATEAHYLLGLVHENLGDLEQALASYRRVVYLDTNFVPGVVGLANVWRQLGRISEAERGYRNASRLLAALDPDAPVAGAHGATAAEMQLLVQQQLQGLK